MGAYLLLLLNCAALVYCSQNTTDPGHDGEWANKFFKALRHEIESTHQQLLNNQQNTGGCSNRQAIQEVKSEIQDIRRLVSDHNQLVENIRNRLDEIDVKSDLETIRQLLVNIQRAAVRSETRAREQLKSGIDEIRQFIAQQQYWSRNAGPEAEVKCPLGFQYVNGARSCYKVIYEEHNWTSADQRCRGLHRQAHLVAITTRDEDSALKTYLTEELAKNARIDVCKIRGWNDPGKMLWTSGRRMNESSSCDKRFVWRISDSTRLPLSYSHWTQFEPSCRGNIEFCVHMRQTLDYEWNDISCDHMFCPLCETDPLQSFPDPLQSFPYPLQSFPDPF